MLLEQLSINVISKSWLSNTAAKAGLQSAVRARLSVYIVCYLARSPTVSGVAGGSGGLALTSSEKSGFWEWCRTAV